MVVMSSLPLITSDYYRYFSLSRLPKFIESFPCADCILNLHESERNKAVRWTAFAWMPLYDENKAPNRPKQGYNLGSDEQRDTAVYIDAAIVDHPQLDKLTGCPGAVFSNTL